MWNIPTHLGIILTPQIIWNWMTIKCIAFWEQGLCLKKQQQQQKILKSYKTSKLFFLFCNLKLTDYNPLFLDNVQTFIKNIQHQTPLPEFSSRILKHFYGIHAAGIKGSCLFRSLHFKWSVSWVRWDLGMLVAHFWTLVVFSQEKPFWVTLV